MEILINHKKINAYGLFFLAFVIIVFVEHFAVQQVKFYEINSFLPYAVGIDLLIIVPILYYFLIVRQLKQNVITLVFGLSLAVSTAYLIIPKTHHFLIEYAEKLLIIMEIGVVFYIIIKFKSIIQEYNLLNKVQQDFVKNIRISFQKHVGTSPLINFLVSELIMLRYGLFFWLGAKRKSQNQDFTMHQNSGFIALFSVIIFVGIIECFVAHLLLNRFNELLAWVITGISIYSFVFLVAHLFSVVDQKITIESDKIIIRIGIFWNFEIEKKYISEVAIIKKEIDKTTKEELNTSKLLLTQPNILIKLSQKQRISGIYGVVKEIDAIYLHIDEFKKFYEELK